MYIPTNDVMYLMLRETASELKILYITNHVHKYNEN